MRGGGLWEGHCPIASHHRPPPPTLSPTPTPVPHQTTPLWSERKGPPTRAQVHTLAGRCRLNRRGRAVWTSIAAAGSGRGATTTATPARFNPRTAADVVVVVPAIVTVVVAVAATRGRWRGHRVRARACHDARVHQPARLLARLVTLHNLLQLGDVPTNTHRKGGGSSDRQHSGMHNPQGGWWNGEQATVDRGTGTPGRPPRLPLPAKAHANAHTRTVSFPRQTAPCSPRPCWIFSWPACRTCVARRGSKVSMQAKQRPRGEGGAGWKPRRHAAAMGVRAA